MEVGKIIFGTFVNVGSGVNVLRSVAVAVPVGGMAACVCVEAASAVRTIMVLIAFESSGNTGVGVDGAHAIMSTSAKPQKKSFLVELVMLRGSLSHARPVHPASGP